MANNKHFIYGYHAVEALIKRYPELIQAVFIQQNRSDQRMQAILEQLQALNSSPQKMPKAKLDALVASSSHQGIAVQCRSLPAYSEHDLTVLIEQSDPTLFLVLDGVQDPHNLGACMRTADAMGVTAIIVPKNRAVNITPTVNKVSCGASLSVPLITVTNLARTLRDIKQLGVWLVGTVMDEETLISEIDMTGSIAVVMGSEGEGMRRLTRECCDYLAQIPMCGTVESLNVSVATGMVLYEVRRQRTMI